MHAEVTSPNTLTNREEERRLCQPQKHSLISRSSKEMDRAVFLCLQVQLRNMHNKTIIGFGFRMVAIISKAPVFVIRLILWLRQITQTLALIIIAIILNLMQQLSILNHYYFYSNDNNNNNNDSHNNNNNFFNKSLVQMIS